MRLNVALLLAGSLFAQGAVAENFLMAYLFGDNELDLRQSGVSATGGKVDGDGFGFRGQFEIAENIDVQAEYQAVDYDGVELDITQWRVGVGTEIAFTSWLSGTVSGEVVDLDVDTGSAVINDTGVAMHAGLLLQPVAEVGVNASVGFVSIDDAHGPEFKAGVSIKLHERVMMFSDYRRTALRENGDSLDINDWRLGAGVTF